MAFLHLRTRRLAASSGMLRFIPASSRQGRTSCLDETDISLAVSNFAREPKVRPYGYSVTGSTESIDDTTLDNSGYGRRLSNPDGCQACGRRSPTRNQPRLAGARGRYFSRPDRWYVRGRPFGSLRLHSDRCMVLLAGCTGLRVSEVMGLRWTGINFEGLVIEIREGYARSQVTKLKSECSRDELPLDPDVATILLEWKRLCPATEGDWVFPSPRTEKPYDSGSLRKKMLQPATLRAKIQERIGWHTFRHSYRAWLDETGAPLGVQQKLMRHANISTTMNVYGGAFMESKRKANTSVVQRVLVQDHTK